MIVFNHIQPLWCGKNIIAPSSPSCGNLWIPWYQVPSGSKALVAFPSHCTVRVSKTTLFASLLLSYMIKVDLDLRSDLWLEMAPLPKTSSNFPLKSLKLWWVQLNSYSTTSYPTFKYDNLLGVHLLCISCYVKVAGPPTLRVLSKQSCPRRACIALTVQWTTPAPPMSCYCFAFNLHRMRSISKYNSDWPVDLTVTAPSWF